MNLKPKLTVENLYEHLQQARQRLSLLLHLNHDEGFYLVAAGSEAVPLPLDPGIARQLLKNEIEKASRIVHDLERKVEIINRMLEGGDANLKVRDPEGAAPDIPQELL